MKMKIYVRIAVAAVLLICTAVAMLIVDAALIGADIPPEVLLSLLG